MEIKKALYDKSDVTEKLKTLLLNNTNSIIANNLNFGDPSIGKQKVLIINYVQNGIEKTIKINENEPILINIPIFEFIIPTYNREKPLYSMLSSLYAQTRNNWKATIVVDDIENNRVKEIVSKFNTNNISYFFTGKRYCDFGHTPRNMGKQASKSNYVILTGDDNYYVPTFIEELTQIVGLENVGMIYWDMIHNGYKYNYFETKLIDGCIDMGAFATRTDLAQQIQLSTNLLAADSKYISDFLEKFSQEKIIKINKVLFVHN